MGQTTIIQFQTQLLSNWATHYKRAQQNHPTSNKTNIKLVFPNQNKSTVPYHPNKSLLPPLNCNKAQVFPKHSHNQTKVASATIEITYKATGVSLCPRMPLRVDKNCRTQRDSPRMGETSEITHLYHRSHVLVLLVTSQMENTCPFLKTKGTLSPVSMMLGPSIINQGHPP